jgi:hypothetical protein
LTYHISVLLRLSYSITMDATESTILRDLRARIDAGEEFNSTLLARYQALEARASAGNLLSHPMLI